MKASKTSGDIFNIVNRGLAAEWFDGMPLGNGDLGALMICRQRELSFALGKSDLWDNRCDNGEGKRTSFKAFETFSELKKHIEQQNWDIIEKQFTKSSARWKGKFMMLPAAKFRIDTDRFEKEIELKHFHRRLDMQRGIAESSFETRVRKQHTEAVVSFSHSVFALKLSCKLDPSKGCPPRPMTFGMDLYLDINPVDEKAKIKAAFKDGVFYKTVKGYYKVEYTVALKAVNGKIMYDGKNDRVTVEAKKGGEFFVYAAVVSNNDSSDTLKEAAARVKKAARKGYEAIKRDNRQWWKKFWSKSTVEIPDNRLLRQYNFGLYLLGSSSRRGFLCPACRGFGQLGPRGQDGMTIHSTLIYRCVIGLSLQVTISNLHGLITIPLAAGSGR